jgi:thiol-disulfide isomerase/thioredoxin
MAGSYSPGAAESDCALVGYDLLILPFGVSLMARMLFASLLLLGLVVPAWSQEKADDASALAKVKADPGDEKAWSAYATQQFGAIQRLTQSDPKAALKQLEEFEAVLGSVEPTSDAAKTMVGRIKPSLTFYRNNIELAQTSREDLEKKLAENPDDAATLDKLIRKVSMEIGSSTRSQPAEAEAKLTALKDQLGKLKESAKEESTKSKIDTAVKNFANLERSIASAKKLAELIGKDAAPLAVEAWVNGKPLTDADLKGKVVLLDFWAVWCGPCIATFPHLRDWQAEYGDKGLVIIGVTGYYKYKWDDETKRQKSDKEASKEDEQAMLVKFAEMHSLKHRFAIQDGRSMSEYYGVTGIPEAVVIDQQGKVQLVRVGSGDANAKDIDDLLKKLLSDKPTSK